METLIDSAAQAVALDMAARPPRASDGIWRFDAVLRPILGVTGDHPKEFWNELERRARARNAGKDAWDPGGYGVVASYASTMGAFATPGFAEARRKHMS